MAAIDLHDVVNNELDPGMAVEFNGLFLIHEGGGNYSVQLEGHAGMVDRVSAEDYADPLALVDDLVYHLIKSFELRDYQDDNEQLIEWAGKIMTSDKERAEENPDTYLYVPDDLEQPE